MKSRHDTAHALMWAAAIIASALSKAPDLLTLILLPGLAVVSLLVAPRRCAVRT